MLQMLQTGNVLYILAAVCGLGVISKLVTSSLYKRLVKETGNMALTRNKNLRALKQRTENMLLLNTGIRNMEAYIEKQIYSFRVWKLSLDSWDNLSVQAMILCFLIGGISAFGAYWYRCDSYYIVLYGTVGILSGLLLVFVDNSVNISLKRQCLVDSLVDYVENSPHFQKSVGKMQTGKGGERKEEFSRRNEDALRRGEETVRRNEDLLRRGEDTNRRSEDVARSIDSLKQSLSQIAATREQSRRELKVVKPAETERTEPAGKELSPEDLKFLEELIQEYMS